MLGNNYDKTENLKNRHAPQNGVKQAFLLHYPIIIFLKTG